MHALLPGAGTCNEVQDSESKSLSNGSFKLYFGKQEAGVLVAVTHGDRTNRALPILILVCKWFTTFICAMVALGFILTHVALWILGWLLHQVGICCSCCKNYELEVRLCVGFVWKCNESKANHWQTYQNQVMCSVLFILRSKRLAAVAPVSKTPCDLRRATSRWGSA